MIHPATERRYINDMVGYGVVATDFIPAGTIIWTLCPLDITLNRTQIEALPAASRAITDVYGYVDANGSTVLCWDDGRFVNHSCDPAMLSLGASIELCVRDLAPGDELTCDYGNLNYLQALDCACGSPRCRGTIRAEDALDDGEAQRASLAQALRRSAHVAQPLLPFVQDRVEWAGFVDGSLTIPNKDSFYFRDAVLSR